MPKKRTRGNLPFRTARTVQSASALLQRMGARAPVAIASGEQRNVAIERLCAGLPAAVRAHIVGGVEKADELVVLVDSAAWAARLKLLLADAPPAGESRRVTVRIMPRKP